MSKIHLFSQEPGTFYHTLCGLMWYKHPVTLRLSNHSVMATCQQCYGIAYKQREGKTNRYIASGDPMFSKYEEWKENDWFVGDDLKRWQYMLGMSVLYPKGKRGEISA